MEIDLTKSSIIVSSDFVENVEHTWSKLDLINERTKKHTKEIKEIEKEIKIIKSKIGELMVQLSQIIK